MSTQSSLPGAPSLTFGGIVGKTYDAETFPIEDYVIDSSRYDSEGNWAFCRFQSDEVYAARMGFQKGGFNITEKELSTDKTLLQLHLELMTREGAVLWLPTGAFDGEAVESDSKSMNIRLSHEEKEIFSISGWPRMTWHFQSVEGDAEANLEFTLQNVTVLPDCILPHCVFSMWETMSDVEGFVRFKDRKTEVNGKVFFDHPRIINQRNGVIPRHLYLYTTMYFEDGSGIFGYHAEDKFGKPLAYYCFGIRIDPQNQGRFLADAEMKELRFDENNLPASWRLGWWEEDQRIDIEVTVKTTTLLQSWGSALAPKTQKDFIILPLVLDGTASVQTKGKRRTMRGYGLAEYFNVDYWGV
jgi:hypothetical protein